MQKPCFHAYLSDLPAALSSTHSRPLWGKFMGQLTSRLETILCATRPHCMQQDLLSQPATQGDTLALRKRRKTTQQGYAAGLPSHRSAKHKDTDTSPLTEPWQAACSDIQRFLEGLAPPAATAGNPVDDVGERQPLQTLLHMALAARRVQSAGLTAALCALAAKWVKHIIQQQQLKARLAGPNVSFDLIGECTTTAGLSADASAY